MLAEWEAELAPQIQGKNNKGMLLPRVSQKRREEEQMGADYPAVAESEVPGQ